AALMLALTLVLHKAVPGRRAAIVERSSCSSFSERVAATPPMAQPVEQWLFRATAILFAAGMLGLLAMPAAGAVLLGLSVLASLAFVLFAGLGLVLHHLFANDTADLRRLASFTDVARKKPWFA